MIELFKVTYYMKVDTSIFEYKYLIFLLPRIVVSFMKKKRHNDVSRGKLSMDATPKINRVMKFMNLYVELKIKCLPRPPPFEYIVFASDVPC